MQERQLLILDLDETLVFASELPLAHAHDHALAPYYLYRRPYLSAFLRHVAARFEVAVWTSSSPNYARGVCETIFADQAAPAFIWARDRCTPRRDLELDTWADAKYLRKLKRHGYPLEKIIMVDDSPEKHRQNFGNLVQVAPFMGQPDDEELPYLAAYLEQLRAVENVRKVEKRHWRTHVEAPLSLLW